MGPQPRLVEVRKNVLKQNDLIGSLRFASNFALPACSSSALYQVPARAKRCFLGEDA